MGCNSLISIIVPIYGVEKYLERCVESILNQTYNNLEIILVDDGSPDDCGRICDEYSKKDSRVVVIHKENGGLSSARNSGLDIAKGEYIGFVDSDDYIELDMYERLYDAIKMNNAFIACAGIFRENEENGNSVLIRCPLMPKLYNTKEALIQCLSRDEIGVSVWCKLYHRNVFEDIRFPVGETNEDAAILVNTLKFEPIVHVGKGLYHYIIRNNSITSTFNSKKNAWAYNNALETMKQCTEEFTEVKLYAEYNLGQTAFQNIVSYYNTCTPKDDDYKKYYNTFVEYWKIVYDFVSDKKIKIQVILARYKLLKVYYRLKKMKYRYNKVKL